MRFKKRSKPLSNNSVNSNLNNRFRFLIIYDLEWRRYSQQFGTRNVIVVLILDKRTGRHLAPVYLNFLKRPVRRKSPKTYAISYILVVVSAVPAIILANNYNLVIISCRGSRFRYDIYLPPARHQGKPIRLFRYLIPFLSWKRNRRKCYCIENFCVVMRNPRINIRVDLSSRSKESAMISTGIPKHRQKIISRTRLNRTF